MRRGFSLVEVMVVVALLGVLLACLAEVGAAATRQGQASAALDRGAQMADRAVKQLRRDMWGASSIWLSESGSLHIDHDGRDANGNFRSESWEITGKDRRTLRRTAILSPEGEVLPRSEQSDEKPDGAGRAVNLPTHEDFPLPAAARFEMATEKFVNPGAWGGPGPIPHAIRLHLGDDAVYLPNRGVFTYGFAVESGHVSRGPVPEIAP